MSRTLTILSASLLLAGFLSIGVVTSANAQEASQEVSPLTESNESAGPSVVPKDEVSQSTKFQTAFLKRQVDQTMSVGRAISSIAGHYPQDIVLVVDIALDTYPDKYREIIFAAISAQPSSTEEIVRLAIEKEVSSCPNIVKLAITAEPTYVDFVVHAAAMATPEELDEIVRVAVLTQPDSADSIVQTLSQEHPNKIVEIMTSALNAVPFVGEYVVDALLAVFPNKAEKVVETAVRESSQQREQIMRILNTANNSDVSQIKLKEYALSAGLSESDFTAAVGN
ncbi:hypothetical protein [Alteromonas sp.]|uniref:hypothetical protein n=1 Tax=Alteromonas sp. TaxID=232 RepID=UPI000B6C0DD1|nr:hypothetical protein [Alteromonas sp.]MAI36783.1 hypothetical protein [Alteromonas sp.]OUX90564.1 MAG: hypothetical protein CBB95_04255 [Alteromonas sp. TMED35]|tara:strand:- start:7651 stop:8496 length:846 start_codon:yes stop_codon:yes gene_type:complete